jgi:flagellar assembly protein FliH
VTAAAQRSWFEKRESATRAVAWRGGGDGGGDGGAADAEHEPARDHDETTRFAMDPAQPAPALSADLEALHVAEAALAACESALAQARGELSAARTEHAAALAQHEEDAAAMRAAVTQMRDEAEIELVKLALAVAERVVGRELETAPALVVQWARDVIAGSALGDHFELALSTELASSLDGEAWGDLAAFVTTDPALPPGTCEVRDAGTMITVDARTRLDLVSEHLATTARSEAA